MGHILKPNMRFAQHFNGHMLCSIDIETTGLEPRKNDIWQFACVPLAANFQPNPDIMPFECKMKLARPENYDRKCKGVNHRGVQDAMINGFDPFRACDLFIEWYEKLALGVNKQIMPLGAHYIFDSFFIKEWMGFNTYAYIFHAHYRDVMTLALSENDRASMHGKACPYPRANMEYLCTTLGVVNSSPHDAMSDAVAQAEVYRRQTMQGLF